MSGNKHSNFMGSKNPNLKNPAAGGGVRSSSSPHSPAVGTQDSAFVRAIISNILTHAKKKKVPVTHDEARFFAIAYAEANPPINLPRGRQFEQEHVDAAFEQFKKQYQPPQPAPQPRNPNNLFGQLLRLGRPLGIQNEILIQYIRWWTSLEGIREIAENPSEEDVNNGYHEMVKAISPGAEIFRNVSERGISSETLGPENFRKLMIMKNCPQHHQVYGIESCRNLRKLIYALSFKEVAGFSHVSCFITGFFIELDGRVVFFNYPDFKNSGTGWNRNDMEGKPVFFWASKVGSVKYRKTQEQFDAGQHDYTLGVGPKGAGYSGESISYDHQGNVCKFAKLKKDALHQEMTDDKHDFFARPHVTAPEKENLDVGMNHELEREIRRNEEYRDACREAMARIGCIPVSMCSTFGHEDAVKAEESDQSGEAALFEQCYHDNLVKEVEKYTPCQSCKLHPGKGAIVNGWGEVVGYRNAP